MKIKGWQDFLLESVFHSSDILQDYLKKIDNKISRELVSLLGKDIKTKYNFLNVADSAGDIFFWPDSKVQKDSSTLQTKPSKGAIGRVVGGILRDNSIEFTSKELEDFVRKFGALWLAQNDHSSRYQIVEGEEIRKWYLESNYSEQTKQGKGTLGKSCMRYKRCSEFLDIYVLNPNVVKMLILLDDKEELRMRMLLWNLDDEYYCDRCYYTIESEQGAALEWLEKNLDKPLITDLDPEYGYSVKLGKSTLPEGKFTYYPYMDSFKYYNPKDMELSSDEPETQKLDWYLLNQTDGYFARVGLVYCDYENEEYPEDDCVWSEPLGTWILGTNAVESTYHGGWIYKPASVWSEKLGSWILTAISKEAWLDLQRSKKSWLPTNLTSNSISAGRLEYWDLDLKKGDEKPEKVILDWLLKKYPVSELKISKKEKNEFMDSQISYKNFPVLELASRIGIVGGTSFSKEIEDEIVQTFFSGEENSSNYEISEIISAARHGYTKIIQKHFEK
jgi:hypothetical protein